MTLTPVFKGFTFAIDAEVYAQITARRQFTQRSFSGEVNYLLSRVIFRDAPRLLTATICPIKRGPTKCVYVSTDVRNKLIHLADEYHFADGVTANILLRAALDDIAISNEKLITSTERQGRAEQ